MFNLGPNLLLVKWWSYTGSVVGRGFTVLFSSAGLVFDTFSTGGFLSEIR